MKKSRISEKIMLGFLVLLLAVSATSLAFAAIPPLETATFPVGTYVIPMDEKQSALAPGDVEVFGFIWAILNDGADIYRIIEPPDVTLKTTTNPGGAVYSGGVILVMEAHGAIITAQQTNFTTVIVDTLTEPFTSDKVLFVNKPTNILVIYGVYGHTQETLDWMGIPYTLVNTWDVEADPAMLLNYDLVVDDCPGWDGYVPPDVVTNMQTLASNGGEIIFTDIALLDLAQVFPGYVSVVDNLDWTGNVTIHNPPLTGFPAEYPSQYPATFPSTVKLYTMIAGQIVDSVLNPTDVRVIMDSSVYDGAYRILASYFPYGDGVVEAFAYHPQEQTEDITGDPWSYVVSATFYGNKFVTAVRAHQLTIDVVGSGTTDPVPGVHTYAEGSVVSVDAVPDAGWMLDHWLLDMVDVGAADPFDVTMDADHNLTAVFVEKPVAEFDLTIDVVGSGTTDPVPGVHTYAEGSVVSVDAVPDAGWMLDHWLLDTVDVGAADPYDVTMDADHALTAVFVEKPVAPATIESCDSTGVQKDTFDLDETVYVTGSGYEPSTVAVFTYDIYVVDDVTWSDGMAIPERVPGTATTVSSDILGNVLPTLVWSDPLTPGKYDIVVDVNDNGVYDEGIDALDDMDIQETAGFFVIPEYVLGTIVGLIACFAAFGLLLRSKRLHRA